MANESTSIGQSLVRQPDTISYSPDKGEMVSENWKGTQEEIENKYDLMKFDNTVENMTVTKGAVYKLSIQRSATSTSNQQQNDNTAKANPVWEVYPEEIQQDLKSAPYFQDGAYFPDEFMPEIDKAITDGKAAETDWKVKFDDVAETYYKHKIAGTNSFPLFRWVIRKTITVNKASKITVDAVEALGSKPKVCGIEDIGLPSDTVLKLPDDYQFLIIPATYQKEGKKRTITYEWRGAERYSPSLFLNGNKELWDK